MESGYSLCWGPIVGLDGEEEERRCDRGAAAGLGVGVRGGSIDGFDSVGIIILETYVMRLKVVFRLEQSSSSASDCVDDDAHSIN